jgi:DNA adenine methylase
MAKPFLKWVGGKTQLLPDLTRLAPKEYGTYYEPFLGGGALFFALEPSSAVLNDLNPHLAELYIDVRDNTDEFLNELSKIQKHYLSSDDHETRRGFFLEYRSMYNIIGSSVHKSALFFFLNKTCFNGVYRENPRGEFNVPFGRNNLQMIFDEQTLKEASRALKKTSITSGSYEKILEKAVAGDFIYFDPPYVPLSKTASFTKYTSNGFGHEHQVALRDAFMDLSDRGCLIMLSNSSADEVRELYKDFFLHEVQASRSINCKAQGRGKITELIVTNF